MTQEPEAPRSEECICGWCGRPYEVHPQSFWDVHQRLNSSWRNIYGVDRKDQEFDDDPES